MPDYPEWFLDLCRSVTTKRPKTVIDHILEHGHITTEELKDDYGHVAMRQIRRLDLIWEGNGVSQYGRIRESAAAYGVPLPDFVKEIIRRQIAYDTEPDE